MESFYLILSFDESTHAWEPGMFIYKTLESAEQSFYKLTDEQGTKDNHKIIKVTEYETITR